MGQDEAAMPAGIKTLDPQPQGGVWLVGERGFAADIYDNGTRQDSSYIYHCFLLSSAKIYFDCSFTSCKIFSITCSRLISLVIRICIVFGSSSAAGSKIS